MQQEVGSEDQLAPVFRDAGEGEAIWAMGSLFEMKVDRRSSAGALWVAEVTQPPGIATPLHVHHDGSEAFFLLEGSILYEAGDQLSELRAGGFVFLPAGIPHRFRITGSAPARFIAIAVPGELSDLYREVGTPARERRMPPSGPPDPEEIGRWMAAAPRYGLQVVGSPLPEPN